ncbi:hypothetical protein Bca4012_075827 [Brassica carinata]|uniref:Uncharacterized protein n=1 Tax=Brassica carinata TaxID=52824 RepID=A0A8X7QB87_BRACI|nr:hypothetical protein Bca52824_073787 [Brassica carinata]
MIKILRSIYNTKRGYELLLECPHESRQCCGYVQDWTVLLLWSARVKALHWFSKAVEKGEPRSMDLILFPHVVV